MILVGFWLVLLVLLAACQSPATPSPVDRAPTDTPARTTQSKTPTARQVTLTPEVTHLPTDTPDEIAQNCCADYRIGLLQAPTTLNYWRYLAEDNSPWTGYVIGDEAPSLYQFPATHHAQRLDFVPALAVDLPPAVEQQDDLWVIPVKMIPAATWSDGEPITAQDVVFTVETVFDLQLGGRWAEFYPAESLVAVRAPDDHTVVFSFDRQPGLSEWQFAVAMGPILPQHYWAEYVEAALALVEGIDPPETCAGMLSEAQQSACRAYERARRSLLDFEPVSAPTGGGYVTAGSTSDSTLRRYASPYFYAAEMKINEYADGTWERVFSDGTLQQFYGPATGDPMISYHRGPFSDQIEFKIYASRLQAYDALAKGRLEIVLNPDGLTDDWLLQTAQSSVVEQYRSPQNGLAYLGFNLRQVPGALPEFREALEILIDRQKIVEKDLQDLVYPAFSIIPPQNAFWWNPKLSGDEETLSEAERFELALQTLKNAGWTWKTEPSWNASARQVNPGVEPRYPDGQPLSEVQFIYPDADENLLMATFGEAIAEAMLGLGVPLVSQPLPRSLMINRTLIAGGSFDLYVLDWQFPLYPGYLCDLFDSQNDTLLTGGYNTTGYSNPGFDERCENFLAETDIAQAQERAYSLQAMLADERPYLPLFYPEVIDLLSDKVVPPYWPPLDGIAGQSGFQTDARVLKK